MVPLQVAAVGEVGFSSFLFFFLKKNCFGTGVGICRLDTVHPYSKPSTSSKNVEENSTLQKDKTASGRGVGVGPARSNGTAQQPSLVSACAPLLPSSGAAGWPRAARWEPVPRGARRGQLRGALLRRAHGTLAVLSARCSGRIGPVLWCSTARRRRQHRSADATEESTRRHTGKGLAVSVVRGSSCLFEPNTRAINDRPKLSLRHV
jgi:hypothetical protein